MMEQFYNYLLLNKHCAKSTARLYCANIQLLLRNGELNFEKFQQFLAKSLETLKPNYLRNIVSAAKIYTQFLKDCNRDYDPLFLTCQYPKANQTNKAILNDDEIEAIINLPIGFNQKGFYYHRFTMFIKILAFTGMRPGEAGTLTKSTIDFGRNCFCLVETKNGHSRLVPIPPNIRKDLQNYLNILQTDKLFPGIDATDWGDNFKKRCLKLGIYRKGLSIYSLRHSLITRLIEEDVNLFKIQKIVGHRKVDTTAAYTHLTTKDIQQAILKHPLIRKQTDPKLIIQSIKEMIESYDLQNNSEINYKSKETNRFYCCEIRLKARSH
jgi:integrase